MSQVSLLPSVKSLTESCHSHISNVSGYLDEVSEVCSRNCRLTEQVFEKVSTTHETVKLSRAQLSSQTALIKVSIIYFLAILHSVHSLLEHASRWLRNILPIFS